MISRKIKSLCALQGITQGELADKIRMSAGLMSKMSITSKVKIIKTQSRECFVNKYQLENGTAFEFVTNKWADVKLTNEYDFDGIRFYEYKIKNARFVLTRNTEGKFECYVLDRDESYRLTSSDLARIEQNVVYFDESLKGGDTK